MEVPHLLTKCIALPGPTGNEALDRVVAEHERLYAVWIDAYHHVEDLETALAAAPAEHEKALTEAIRTGENPDEIADPTPKLRAELADAEIRARAAATAVVGQWDDVLDALRAAADGQAQAHRDAATTAEADYDTALAVVDEKRRAWLEALGRADWWHHAGAEPWALGNYDTTPGSIAGRHAGNDALDGARLATHRRDEHRNAEALEAQAAAQYHTATERAAMFTTA